MATKDDYIRYWKSQGISLADLEPVIRCKDCEYFDIEGVHGCCLHDMWNGTEDYCSLAKRKDVMEE